MRATTFILALAALGLAVTAGAVVDPLALRSGGRDIAALDALVEWADWLSLRELSDFLPALLLLTIGGVMFVSDRRSGGRVLVFLALVQSLSFLAADLAKPLFGRMRPFQVKDGIDHWFAGPDFGSFPSGHVAFYAGLFVPIALLFPRFAVPALVLPLLVAAERILSHDHYPSDAIASLAIVLAVAASCWPVLPARFQRAAPRQAALAAG